MTGHSMRSVIKQACGVVDLPTVNFSGKSMRKGMTSHAVSCGADPAAYKARAGFALNSLTPETHYVSSYSRGTWSAAVDGTGQPVGLGAEGVRGLLPAGTLSVSRRHWV